MLSYDDVYALLERDDLSSIVTNGVVDEQNLNAAIAQRLVQIPTTLDGNRKIFRIAPNAVVQIAGRVDYASTDAPAVLQQLADDLQDDPSLDTGSAIFDLVMERFRPHLTPIALIGGRWPEGAAPDAQLLVSHFDPTTMTPTVSVAKYERDLSAPSTLPHLETLAPPNRVFRGALTTTLALEIASVALSLSVLWQRMNSNGPSKIGGVSKFAILDAQGYREFDAPVRSWLEA